VKNGLSECPENVFLQSEFFKKPLADGWRRDLAGELTALFQTRPLADCEGYICNSNARNLVLNERCIQNALRSATCICDGQVFGI
jgi:hypothetical protein